MFPPMTVADAIDLAHQDRDLYPFRQLRQPPPTPQEALEILRESVRCCWFNWLTGREAVRLLAEATRGAAPEAPVQA